MNTQTNNNCTKILNIVDRLVSWIIKSDLKKCIHGAYTYVCICTNPMLRYFESINYSNTLQYCHKTLVHMLYKLVADHSDLELDPDSQNQYLSLQLQRKTSLHCLVHTSFLT